MTGSREKVHWKHYFSQPGYESVGLYEGVFWEFGAYRATQINVMMGGGDPRFNAPSREAIVRRILKVAGISFDFEEFLRIDRKTKPDESLFMHPQHVSTWKYTPEVIKHTLPIIMH